MLVTMKARVYGFRIGGVSTCTLKHLAKYIRTVSGAKFSLSKQDRVIFAGTREGKCVGVLLSLKEQRRFPELEEDSLTLHIHEVEEGRTPFDFNFFAFDPLTGGGVLQHYRGSCSILTFGSLLKRLYDDISRNQCEGSTTILQSRASGYLQRKEQLDFAVAYRRESFEDAVAELATVTTFEYDIFTQTEMSKELIPFSDKAKLERRTVKFKASVTGKSILDGIKSLMPNRSKQGAFRVTGDDIYGDQHSIDLNGNMPDEFHSEELDALADKLILRLDDIAKSPFVDKMLAVLSDNQALFGPEE